MADIFTITTIDGVTESTVGSDKHYTDGINTAVIPISLLNPAAPPLAASPNSKWDWLEGMIKIVIESAKKRWP